MTKHFSCIGVLAQVNKSSVKQTVNELLTLLHVNGYCVLIGEAAGAMLTARIKQAAKQVPNEQLAAECDVLIVVGGDGSMLQASSLLAGKKIPMLGVNRGRLGFLADIYPDLLHKVLAVLAGDYECDERFLLSMAVLQDGHVLHETTALNDVVLHAGKSVHTIDFELSIDGQRVYRQHADGLIVATPTGSTAYNLSAGGSIVHPSLSAICLTPMYPHTLSSRPLLVSDSSCIEIRVHEDNRTQPMISPDGKSSHPLTAKQVLRITKYPHALTLLHPKGFDFYEACRTKLHWSLYGDEFYLKNKY